MTDKEQKIAAKEFADFWKDKGYEKGQSQTFWLQLLSKVLGISNPEKFIEFEDQVHIDKNTGFIDGYIPSTKILIEQKSIDKDLRKGIRQSDGSLLNPFQQAKKYIAELPVSRHPKWVITCNFKSFLIYNMENPNGEPEEILLKDLEKEYYRLQFIVDTENSNLKKEMEISIQAGELVGKIYDEILPLYKDPENKETLRSLNMLCVRLVFCLYAEDAGLFGKRLMFHDYLSQFEVRDLRRALIDLFKVLDTKIEDRDPYLIDELAQFPYVNGGLFADENIEIPNLNEKVKEMLLSKASEDFDWSEISPTIFGAVFESTLNPETRRSGGMHYTSIENIHKVIDPLFLDELKNELQNKILDLKTLDSIEKNVKAFQEKISNLKFLDPACGSGNFLTETYISLRKLENMALEKLYGGQIQLAAFNNPIKVSISQFYGIEINDFAVTVAKTALWIAESQMMKKTENILHINLNFLPLKSYTNIVEGNALKIDWNTIVDKNELNYIMGNPPFIGQAMRTKEQANDIQNVFLPSKAGGKLDYVAGWFKKASDLMKNSKIETAFVSSNSICQGESVNLLWELLIKEGININFAYTTFRWTSEAKEKAAVMCVIVGFSYLDRKNKLLFDDGNYKVVEHINAYLKEAPNLFIKNRTQSINKGLAKVVQGSPPADDGRLLLSKEEKDIWIAKYPELKDVIKPFVGSREFINDIDFSRFCFWFVDKNPSDFSKIPELLERFEYIRQYRLDSPVDRIQKTADKPYLFTQNRQPLTDYLIIPRVSSSTRKYVPIGFLKPDVIASDSVVLVYNATLVDFGLICSNVHNAWMRTIAGRLKNDYRYAPSVYYNFPMPELTEISKEKIKNTSQKILEARKIYKNHSLADMYGENMYLYPELLKAHQENDKAVMEAYGFDWRKMTESDCVAELMKMYQDIIIKNNE